MANRDCWSLDRTGWAFHSSGGCARGPGCGSTTIGRAELSRGAWRDSSADSTRAGACSACCESSDPTDPGRRVTVGDNLTSVGESSRLRRVISRVPFGYQYVATIARGRLSVRLHRLAGLLTTLVFALPLVAGLDAACVGAPEADAPHHAGMIMPGTPSGDPGMSPTSDGAARTPHSDDCHHAPMSCQQMATCAAYIAVSQPWTDAFGPASGEVVVSPPSNIWLGPTYAPDLPPPRV